MVKTYTAPDDTEAICTSCGVQFKSAASHRNRRMACPKCRASVLLEHPADPVPVKKGRAPAAPEADADRSASGALEARIAALEATVAALIIAGSAAEDAGGRKKLEWVATSATDLAGVFSPEKMHALTHNLGTAKAREITFRIHAGDPHAGARVSSLMGIFERAGWAIHGPAIAGEEANPKFLVLGVPTVPVGKEAAETYLALKAAGFDPVPLLDTALANDAGVASLSLTLPVTT